MFEVTLPCSHSRFKEPFVPPRHRPKASTTADNGHELDPSCLERLSPSSNEGVGIGYAEVATRAVTLRRPKTTDANTKAE